MKKSLLICGVAALALASCTQNEVLNVNESRAIGFDAFVGKPTKAAKPTESTLTELQGEGNGFYVYGGYEDVTDVFDNTHVTYSSSSWGYDPIRYWVKDKNYKLLAYAPDMTVTPTLAFGSSSSENDATLSFTDITIDGTTENQNDFVVAKSELITSNGTSDSDIAFNFYHALSMIKITLRNGFADGIKVAVSNFNITGIKTQGDFVISGSATLSAGNCGTWSNVDTPESSTITFKDDAGTTLDTYWTSEGDANNKMAYVNEFIVIPQTIGTVSVNFTINVTDSNGNSIVSNKALKINLPTTPTNSWNVNNRYNYIATISGSSVDLNPINFANPTIDSWGNYNDITDGVTITE